MTGQTVPRVDQIVDEERGIDTAQPWNVILYNDNWHRFDEVVLQVQKATGYSVKKAAEITYAAHTKGRAIVYTGDKEECKRIATVLREIRLQVEIDEV